MNLVLSDDQQMIRDEATRLLADRSSSERVRAVVAAADGFDASLWQSVAGELGWCAMAIPEAYGGLGLESTELMLLMEAVGRRLAALPLWSTACMAAPLIDAVGSEAAKSELLPRLAAGEAATVAWDLHAVKPLDAPCVVARAAETGYILSGSVAQVTDLLAAGIVLVPAELDGQLALFALPNAAGDRRLLPTLDGTRQIGALRLEHVAVPASARIDENGFDAEAAAPALATAALGLAAEQVGAARGVMDLTLDYVASRVQFGRTIASFQAVKHRCARLEIDLAEARAMVYGAAANFAQASAAERRLEAASALVLAKDLLFRAAEEAIQLHGGVGFTWEYDPHLYFKRAQAGAAMLGTVEGNLEIVAAAMLDQEARP
jgi:alkylation response protein AidB-like acyl-CoA dehydrogenase